MEATIRRLFQGPSQGIDFTSAGGNVHFALGHEDAEWVRVAASVWIDRVGPSLKQLAETSADMRHGGGQGARAPDR